jgi:hypothetical protein
VQPQPIDRRALIVVGALVAVVVVLVLLSLRQPELPEFTPTPLDAGAPSGPGPHTLTIDASDPQAWRYVDLERGTVGASPSGPWDLAFRRFEVRVNGGAGFAGQGGVLDLGAVPLDSVARVPDDGYDAMRAQGRDTTLAVLENWYSYSYTTHVLRPRERTFALRTGEGGRAALRFVSYYCPGAQPGCVTLRFRFLD